MHTQLQVLRGKIRGLQLEGATIHNRIRKTKGQTRHELWLRKRQLGKVCREHLIAYAMLRGVPYLSVEKCGEFNRPEFLKVYALIQEHASWNEKRDLTQDKVREFLFPKEKEEL